MNLKTCQYFVALAEEMNFTKASESLHITQQSLSGSIKRLEEEYGVELFQRKPYLKLTPAGETMLFYSKQMLRNESQMISPPNVPVILFLECQGSGSRYSFRESGSDTTTPTQMFLWIFVSLIL